ncbi:hypothetical protein OAK35_02265 [Crocinitomicaceae bacterium]|nr:hypothetical protein [Crocinitomicaceae bacterium]
MRKEKRNVAKEILRNRPSDSLNDALKQSQKLTLYALLVAVAILVVGILEENRVYIPYAIYTIVEFGFVFVFFREFQKVRKYRFLLIAIALFVLTYLLERFHLGELYEPMKRKVPTMLGHGRSVGLVKTFAIMAPFIYLWTKIIFVLIWTITLINAMRLKYVSF